MTPEAKARLRIDQEPEQILWLLQDKQAINQNTSPGIIDMVSSRSRLPGNSPICLIEV